MDASQLMLANSMRDVEEYLTKSQIPDAEAINGAFLREWKYYKNRFIGGTAHGRGAGNASGDMLDLLAATYAKANSIPTTPTRNVYVPNGVDQWGFSGATASQSASTGGTDPSIATIVNIRFCGWMDIAVGAASTLSFLQGNPVASRQGVVTRTQPGPASGRLAGFGGCLGVGASSRVYTLGLPGAKNGYANILMEAAINFDTLTNVDVFMGLCSSSDPTGAVYSTGAMFSSAIDAVNWRAYNNSNGTVSSTSTAVAASTTAAVRFAATFSATQLSLSVNGGAPIVLATNYPPTTVVTMRPILVLVTRSAAQPFLYVEDVTDWKA